LRALAALECELSRMSSWRDVQEAGKLKGEKAVVGCKRRVSSRVGVVGASDRQEQNKVQDGKGIQERIGDAERLVADAVCPEWR
jgi:hypothetical protein